MTPSTPDEKLDFRRIFPVIFIVFVDLMALTIIIPILAYYGLAFNASPFTLGLLAASYPLMQFIGGPILGGLSDRFGRKPVLAVAQLGTFLSLLMLGFANSLWMIFVARLIDGVTGANLSTAQAAITDITTPRTRSQGLGLIGAAFGLGFVLGPAISALALALSGNNYSAPAFVAAGFAFTSMMLTTFVFKETLPPEKRNQGSGGARRGVLAFGSMLDGLRKPVVGILFLVIFIHQQVFGAFQSMFSPFTLTRIGTNSFGNTLFFVYLGVAIVVVQGGLIGRLTRRFGERRLLITGLASVGVGMILMTFTPTLPVPWYQRDAIVEELSSQTGASGRELSQLDLLPSEDRRGWWGLIYLLVVMTPIAVGSGFIQPSVGSLITQSVPAAEIGAVLGLSAAFQSLANVLAPLWAGAAFDFITPYAPFLIGGITSTVLVIVTFNRLKPSANLPSAPQPAAAD
jgi:DHA1 family tetracycline resistance protein-like MFS transporter